jgi:Fe2+ or Zn2+ uptake regulation protein
MSRKNDLFISENEDLKLSSVYVGYEILKFFNKTKKITIYDLYGKARKKQPSLNYSNFINSLTFLHMSGIVEFNKPFFEVKK